jgi:hypothetical protein
MTTLLVKSSPVVVDGDGGTECLCTRGDDFRVWGMTEGRRPKLEAFSLAHSAGPERCPGPRSFVSALPSTP